MNPDPIEFGCVVELHDPNREIRIGHVSYVDPQKEFAVLWMLDDKEYAAFQMNRAFELTDPSIQFYKVKSYPDEPGYARQTGLVPMQWVEIRLHDDMTVYKGQIVEIEEDMITVQLTFPSEKRVYFDFEYRGLIPELGIQSFTKIKESLSSASLPSSSLSSASLSNSKEVPVEDEPQYNDEGERVDSNPLNYDDQDEGVEEMGDDVSVVMDVEIRDNQKQFDIKRQLTEIIDKMYAKYGERTITPLMHAHVSDIIDRFVISRSEYTKLDSYGNAMGIHKQFEDYRPFYVQYAEKSVDMKRCSYIFPVTDLKPLLFRPGEVVVGDNGDFDGEEDPDVPEEPFHEMRDQLGKLIAEARVQTSNTPYYEKIDKLNDMRVPFYPVVQNKNKNQTSYPVETLVRNGDPPIPPLGMRIGKTEAVLTSRPDYTQVYLPGEPMNIHSVYKPPAPRFRKGRFLNPLTPIHIKTAQLESPHYSSMWKVPSSISAEDMHPVTKDAFPLLPAVVHDMAHRFRHCTSYAETLRILEEYATRPQQVDKNTAVQLIDIVQSNISSFSKQQKRYQEFISQLLQKWSKDRPAVDSDMEENAKDYSGIMVPKMADDALEYKMQWMDPIEFRNLAMKSDTASLAALLDRHKNAKLYMEERFIPNMDDMADIPVLAKEYDTVDALREDDGDVTLYFDKKYDTTPYALLEKYKTKRASMDPDQFREWFQETLFQSHGVPVHKTAEMVDWILDGRRPVLEGYYAKVITPLSFYKRTSISSWELDEDMHSDLFIPAKELLQNVEHQSAALPKIQDYSAYATAADQLQRADAELDRRVAAVFHKSVKNIQTMIREHRRKATTRNTYIYQRMMRPYVSHYVIGQTLQSSQEILTSPFFDLLTTIRDKGGVNKDVLILQFYKKYCTDSSVLHLPSDAKTRFWKYCKDTGTPLLPTSEYELARLSMLPSEEQKMAERTRIMSEVGIELDGSIYDKYTGHLLQEGTFEFQEQFTEEGHLNRGHEVVSDMDRMENEMVEKQLNVDNDSYLMESILPPEAANAVNLLDSIKYAKTTTKYELFAPVQYALTIATHLKIASSQIQLPLVRMASAFRSEIKSAEKYNRKLKEGMPDYAVYSETMNVIIALNILLVAIHTAIPSFTTRPSIPSYQDEKMDMEALWKKGMDEVFKHVQILASNRVGPWTMLVDTQTGTIPAARFKKTCLKFFMEKMYPSPSIQAMYHSKLEYVQTMVALKKRERTTYDWPGFLPYLQPIREISKPHTRSSDSRNSILNASYVHAMYIMKQINDAIQTEPIVMQTLANVPYLENGCCNHKDFSIFPLEYFIERYKLETDSVLRAHVANTQSIQLKQKQMPFFFSKPCPMNARDLVMETERFERDAWTDSIQHGFIIYYLNLNETRGFIGVPSAYAHVLAQIPPNWDKNASAEIQNNSFSDIPLKLDVSIEDFVKQIWMQETKSRMLRIPLLTPITHRLATWAEEPPPASVSTPISVHSLQVFVSNQTNRLNELKEVMAKWLSVFDPDSYKPYSFKGLDPDEIMEYISDPIQDMQRMLMKHSNEAGRKCLRQLDAKINVLYNSPHSFHEVVGCIRNMIHLDTAMATVHSTFNMFEFSRILRKVPQPDIDAFPTKMFIYANKSHLTQAFRMHEEDIRKMRLFDPWIQLVESVMEITPYFQNDAQSDDPYIYKGIPPYIVARIYQYAWLNIWIIWISVAKSIPDNVHIELEVEDDEDEDEYSRDRVVALVQEMMNVHLSYHDKSMTNILMSNEDIMRQTHLTKQSEKQQIMDQYKNMTQKDRNLQRALILCGLSRYQLNGPTIRDEDANGDADNGDADNGDADNGDADNGDADNANEDIENAEGEGVQMFSDGNWDE